MSRSPTPALGRLPEDLARRYVPAPDDPETRRWLEGPGQRPHGFLRTRAQRVLRRFVSDFEANARLGMYSLHLGGTATYRAVLGLDGNRSSRLGSLLDVGAGTGEVTEKLAPLFSRVLATETSKAMASAVRKRGIACELVDLTDPAVSLGTFDVVALLNVLDRTARPQTLLDRARLHLLPEGRLLIASPLPARPHVDHAGATADPDEDMGGTGQGFEDALSSFHATLLSPRGLTIERWTRLAYFSQGDADAPTYQHDDVLLVCRAPFSER